jgi:[ribosomal protein S5]-alanine N-acetyltransferase
MLVFMPSFAGKFEVGYTILSNFRRQGFALEAVRGLFDWAKHEPETSVLHEPGTSVLHEPGLRTFVASVSPTNLASLAVIAKLGFVQVGRQWDEEDGEELVFELPVKAFVSS